MQRSEKKPRLRGLLPYGVIAVITLLTALVLFSNVFTRSAGYAPMALTPDEKVALVQAGDMPTVTYAACFDEAAVHSGTGVPARTLTLTFASDSEQPMLLTGRVELSDSAFAPGYRAAATFSATPNGSHRTVTVPLVSEDVLGIRVSFNAVPDAYVLVGAELNTPQPLHFGWGKWLLLFALVSLVYTVRARGWYELVYDRKNPAHRAMMCGTLVLCLAFCGAIAVLGSGTEGFGKPYRSGEYGVTHEQYEMQFDAWQNGSLALLAQPSAELLALPNPYSIEARNAAGTVYQYDTVLYEGKYYSYYGIAPLLCVYYPFYLLTQSLPTGITVCTVLALLAVVGIYGALEELLRALRVRANLLLYLLTAPAVVFGSMIFYNQSCMVVYYVPLLSALAFLAWFVCMALRAVRAEKPALRAVRFVLAAVCLALCVASRPNVAVFCVAFAAPFFLGVLLEKQRPLKRRIGDAVWFAVPAAALCMAVLWYNYARFGSLLEFGSTYNLTNNDIRTNVMTLSVSRVKDMLYNCFLLPFGTQSTFPFVSLGSGSVSQYGRWYYNADCTFGVFALPLAWSVLLMPKTLRKGQAVKNGTYIAVGVTALFIAYVNCCVGGLVERYTCDILLPLLLIGAAILLEVFSKENVRPGGWLYTAVCGVCCATIALGALAVFANHPDLGTYVQDYAPDAYLTLAHWFTLG